MKLAFFGACGEIGRSALAVETGSLKLLLDCGIKVHDHYETPAFDKTKFDACVLSHAHLDHSGSLPVLYKHQTIPAFCSFPTVPLTTILLQDSEKVALQNRKNLPFKGADTKKALKKLVAMPFETEYEFFDGTRFTLHDAGHIPGSAGVLVEAQGKRVFYTGDFKLEATRLHKGALLPESADVLVIESTYSAREHPDRKKLESEFCDAVKKALDEGATVLVPCFAVGRTQEILQVLAAYLPREDVFVEGMGARVNELLHDYPAYLKDFDAFSQAIARAKVVEDRRDRKRIIGAPCVVVATAGMLDGGPALSYLQALNGQNAVVFLTGFQAVGTNGRSLLNGEKILAGNKRIKIDLPVKQFDFSAHAGKKDLLETVKRLTPEKVFCVHGDDCAGFADELKEKGFDAIAPKESESFEL